MEEINDMEISHPYPLIVNLNQADKDLVTHKTIDLETKIDRVINFIEKLPISHKRVTKFC